MGKLTNILDKIASNSESIDFITKKCIKEGAKLDAFLKKPQIDAGSYNELSAEDLYILDVGPSHPHHQRVKRKAERLGPNYVGPTSSRPNRELDHKDLSGALRQGRISDIQRQSNYRERGDAAVSEPMIALGLDPTDYTDKKYYKDLLSCAMSLKGVFDKLEKAEQRAMEYLLSDEYGGVPSMTDLDRQDDDRRNSTNILKKYLPARFKAQQDQAWKKRLSDNAKTAKREIMNSIAGTGAGIKCQDMSVPMMKKVLQVQADNLRPMPAYTPSESEAELQGAGVDVENLMESRYRKRLNRRERYFIKFMLSENKSRKLEKNVKNFLTEVRSGKYLINEFKELPPGCFDKETMQIRNFSPVTGEPCFKVSETCYDRDGNFANYNAADGSLCPGHPNWKYPMNVLNENKNCGCSSCNCKKSKKRNYKMKITKSQLRQIINEVIAINPDGSYGGYAGLEHVGPDHALNQQSLYKKIPGANTRPVSSAPADAKPAPPTQEEIINAIKRAAADIDREKDNAYTHFVEISPNDKDGYDGMLQYEVDKFINISTRNLIQHYLGFAMQKNITASRFRRVLESMLSNKADIKTLYHFKIEDLDAVFGAEPVALNESLSRGSLYRRRYHGRY